MTTPLLLDVNVLLALGWAEHEAHARVVGRLTKASPWTTCSITQLGFVRISSTGGIFSRTLSPAQAHTALQALCADKQHRYVSEQPEIGLCDFTQLSGPRQTIDAYLLALARHHRMKLLTLDKRMLNAFPDAPLELLG